MWLYTKIGFFSAIYKNCEPEEVQVRARVRADLESLRNYMVEYLGDYTPPPIIETPHADYGFRMNVPRSEFADAVSVLCEEIDYPNFKELIADVQGKRRAAVYVAVWRDTLSLDDSRTTVLGDFPSKGFTHGFGFGFPEEQE